MSIDTGLIALPIATPAEGIYSGTGLTANSFDHTVSVLLGIGDGTFSPKVDYTADYSASFVALGDLNGDTFPDLVTANYAYKTVSVLLGMGDGTFSPKMDYTAGDGPWSVALGDLNGDTIPDLVTANSSDDSVSVLLGL